MLYIYIDMGKAKSSSSNKKSKSYGIWRAVKKFTGNRYGRGTKQIISKGVPQMIKDVMYLKKMINVEKKQFNNTTTQALGVAQVVGNSSGHQIFDITPTPTIGTSSTTRNGDSIKVVSAYHKFVFYQQANNVNQTRYIIEYFLVKGRANSSPQGLISDIYKPNRMLGIAPSGGVTGTVYDYNSDRLQEGFKNYVLLKRKRFSLAADNYSGLNNTKEIAIKLQFKNYHIKYQTGTNVPDCGQILCVVRADLGNWSDTVASTITNAIVKPVLTGAGFQFDHTWYFVDN